jgi:hypothetical protein
MIERPDDPHEAPDGLPDDDAEDLPPRAFNEAYQHGRGDDDRPVSDISDRYPEPLSGDVRHDQPIAPEPSIKAIVERIRARSGGTSADARNAAGSPPFARSRNPQTVGKPSFLPSPTVKSGVCYTKLLHNGDGRLEAKPLNGRENRGNFCYTILLHNSRGGLVRRGGWFHFRRRVPDALRSVFGRSPYRTIGSRTDPVVVPVSRACNATASASERLAMQSATNRAGLFDARGRK